MIKILKYFLALLFTAIILIVSTIVVLISFNDENIVTEEVVREVLSSNEIISNPLSGFSQLSADEQATYLRITNELDNLNSSFSISGNSVSEEQFNKIISYILRDHPEYFYVNNVEYLKTPDGTVQSVTFNFTESPEMINIKQQEIEAWRDMIFAGITPDMDNYEIAKYLHDYIVNTTDYDINVNNNQNLLSVVEEARSVCAGYSKAYQYLLNQAGIFSTYVSGAVNIGPHAWNLVEIDGEYGFVDVTWDDPSFQNSTAPDNFLSHTYFGISTEDLLKNHAIDSDYSYISNITTPSFNYFTREELYSNLEDNASYQMILNQIRDNLANGNNIIEIKLENRDQIGELLNKLAQEPFLYTNSINYVVDDYYPIITLILK